MPVIRHKKPKQKDYYTSAVLRNHRVFFVELFNILYLRNRIIIQPKSVGSEELDYPIVGKSISGKTTVPVLCCPMAAVWADPCSAGNPGSATESCLSIDI